MNRSWAPVAAPAEAPDGLVLFDGVCVLCAGWVQFIIARDPEARFRFLPMQTERGRTLAGQLGIEPDEPQTNAVILAGQVFFKSDSAIKVLERLPRWSWVRAFAAVPRPARDWLYDRIARNRYRLFGKRTTCLVPTLEVKRHFLPDADATG